MLPSFVLPVFTGFPILKDLSDFVITITKVLAEIISHDAIFTIFIIACIAIVCITAFMKKFGDQTKKQNKHGNFKVKCLNTLYKDRAKHMKSKMISGKKHLFVFDFNTEQEMRTPEKYLAGMIDVILDTYQHGDEVLLRLQSGGGSVVAFGLYSAILTRLREAPGLTFKVAIDHWAASGGYMIAAVAHEILCAPSAYVGSIGVIFELLNYNRLLDRLGIEVEQHIAGEEKRNITKYGKTNEEKRLKLAEELQETHTSFKNFIKTYRPAVDIEAVATGKIWSGLNALPHRLVDMLITSDAFLYQKSKDNNYQILMIKKNKAKALDKHPRDANSRVY